MCVCGGGGGGGGRGGGLLPVYGIVRMCMPNGPLFSVLPGSGRGGGGGGGG